MNYVTYKYKDFDRSDYNILPYTIPLAPTPRFVVSVPGVKREDISAQLLGDLLVVEWKKGDYSFRKEYQLSDEVDVDNVSVVHELGELVFNLPQVQGYSRKLDIK